MWFSLQCNHRGFDTSFVAEVSLCSANWPFAESFLSKPQMAISLARDPRNPCVFHVELFTSRAWSKDSVPSLFQEIKFHSVIKFHSFVSLEPWIPSSRVRTRDLRWEQVSFLSSWNGFFLWSGYWNRSLRKTACGFSRGPTAAPRMGMIHCMRENPIEMEVSNSSWVSLCFLAAINVSSHRLSCAQMPARMEIFFVHLFSAHVW